VSSGLSVCCSTYLLASAFAARTAASIGRPTRLAPLNPPSRDSLSVSTLRASLNELSVSQIAPQSSRTTSTVSLMAPKVIFADSMDGAVRASIPPGSFMLAPPRLAIG
jgi:hypothetical protein